MRGETETTPTTLLLLPGLDGTGIFFEPLRRHLPPWIEPVVVEYPASGASDYDSLLATVLEQVEGLGRIAVLGWSFGGPLALMLAASRPSQVSAVILCATFVRPSHPRLVPFAFALRPALVASIRAVRRGRLLVPGYASGELRRAKARSWKRVQASALAARTRAVLGVDARGHLRQCRARLMYLASSDDEVVARHCLDEVLQLAPQTRLEEIDGRHLALFTNPGSASTCIADFLFADRGATPGDDLP